MKYSAYKFRMVAQATVAIFAVLAAMRSFGGPGLHPAFTGASLACLVWLISCRTTWLPFLGPTVMPVGLLEPRTPTNATMTYIAKAPADAMRVVYWGSVVESGDPIVAYGGYHNSGIADVVGGQAVMRFQTPKAYSINGTSLPRHIHYRWITATGMLSAVKTAYV